MFMQVKQGLKELFQIAVGSTCHKYDNFVVAELAISVVINAVLCSCPCMDALMAQECRDLRLSPISEPLKSLK